MSLSLRQRHVLLSEDTTHRGRRKVVLPRVQSVCWALLGPGPLGPSARANYIVDVTRTEWRYVLSAAYESIAGHFGSVPNPERSLDPRPIPSPPCHSLPFHPGTREGGCWGGGGDAPLPHATLPVAAPFGRFYDPCGCIAKLGGMCSRTGGGPGPARPARTVQDRSGQWRAGDRKAAV